MKEGFTLVVHREFLHHLPSGKMEIPMYIPKEQQPYLPNNMEYALVTSGRLKRTEKKVDFVLRVNHAKVEILVLWGHHSQREKRFAECGIEVFTFTQPKFVQFVQFLRDERVCIRFDRQKKTAFLKEYKQETKHPV
ncbi:hypothetical protein [Flavobacterium alvei]|uniref:hypothetical protein n=1 Tax=Flavobacterium alvei TaxID=2080416 RepID=UPI0026EF3E65|nr:hypothetical protein [Flavobacterium alvei]